MPQKNTRSLYVLALLLFLTGVGYLCYSGFTEANVYFLNVAEAKAAAPEQLLSARLFGTVASQHLETLGDGRGVAFLLEDKDNARLTIPIKYSGLVPDAFKPGAEVIVEGGMGAEGCFTATTLMTKCQSKYQKENRRN